MSPEEAGVLVDAWLQGILRANWAQPPDHAAARCTPGARTSADPDDHSPRPRFTLGEAFAGLE